ncbi:defensin-like protein 1 [Ricinus communis]|uniref:defensin-like protein 1 n=1 Tax=Ricinus communis TaxID=3988 RepID=UPI0000D6D42D|nr:defensin-like protein 1 [Ricinus communis]|eukprot:XP_015571070.1 defensin-like protein 1 [Ricinus communis]
MEKRSLGLFLLMLIVLLGSQDVVLPTEARVCESKSHHFHGPCLRDHNCALVCRTEGNFSGGRCRGFRRRCFCTRRC